MASPKEKESVGLTALFSRDKWLGVLFVPILILLAAALVLGVYVVSAKRQLNDEGNLGYDQVYLREYANGKYLEYFGESSAVEENIMLLLLVNDTCDGYDFVAWIGDNLVNDLRDEFDHEEETSFVNSCKVHMDGNYSQDLHTSLSAIVRDMKDVVLGLDLDTYYDDEDEVVDTSDLAPSMLYNLTDLQVSAAVNDALVEFTQATGLSIVIVVEDVEEVQRESIAAFDIVMVLAVAVVVVIDVALLVVRIKNKKTGSTGAE